MQPVVKLSYAERIINALAHVEHKRGEDFLVRHKRQADAIRPITDDAYLAGLKRALELAEDCYLEPISAIRAEIAKREGKA
jgi:hypothetical protein